MKLHEVSAFSTTTGIEYPNWAALIEAEANGYLVTVIITGRKDRVWPVSWGPFDTQEEAEKFRARMRNKFRREAQKNWSPYQHQTYAWSVRPAWKPDRERRKA